MAEIDSLNANYYFAGVQNAQNGKITRNTNKEETTKAGLAKRIKFSELLHGASEEPEFISVGLPPEVADMSLDDAAVYLADAVSNAGNDFSDNQTQENLEKFKQSVSQFIRFVVTNNFEVTSRKKMRHGKEMINPSPSSLFSFSNYSVPPRKVNPKYQIQVINEKLDALTRETLSNQMNNLKILSQVNEIKGLIVDLMSS